MALTIGLEQVSSLGSGLKRPECVLALASGDLYVAHMGHGVMHIAPDGTQNTIGKVSEVDGKPWIPNGLALMPDGSFRVANMGEGGGLWRLGRDGALSAVLREVDGVALTATNFVLLDSRGRLWITITTRRWPIAHAFSPLGGPILEDGYLVLLDGAGARIVADGLGFANEVRLSPDEREAYVIETFARRISRFRVAEDGSLSGREVFARFGHGDFVDGGAFDAEGHLWAASIVSNRLVRIAPDGSHHVVMQENDPARVDMVERKLTERTLAREDVQNTPTRVLKNIASVAFGGPDLRTVYLGSLGGDTLGVFRSPVAGAAPVHWNFK